MTTGDQKNCFRHHTCPRQIAERPAYQRHVLHTETHIKVAEPLPWRSDQRKARSLPTHDARVGQPNPKSELFKALFFFYNDFSNEPFHQTFLVVNRDLERRSNDQRAPKNGGTTKEYKTEKKKVPKQKRKPLLKTAETQARTKGQ